MQQDGQRIQEVVVAALKDVDHADQAATHVSAHLHLHDTDYALLAVISLSPCMQHTHCASQLHNAAISTRQA